MSVPAPIRATPVRAIMISPKIVAVATNATQRFTATVLGTTDTVVLSGERIR